MIAVVQRVLSASVKVEGQIAGAIGRGLLILLGVRTEDEEGDAALLARKILHLRIFPDSEGKMNRNVQESLGSLLVVSQFTLYGDTARGNRPNFSAAAPAAVARGLYEIFVRHCESSGLEVKTGVFQADMQVELVNDGPVTLLCRSEK